MKIKLLVAVATSVMAGTAISQSAFEGFYAQVGIGYNDILPKADNVSATIHIRFTGYSRKIELAFDSADGLIVSLDQIPFSMIQTFDRSFFPVDRTVFLSNWIAQPDSFALSLIKDGVICGYGVIRPCRVGFKIGPLFAISELAAEKLYTSLCASVANNSPVFLDVPECNPKAMALAHRHQLQPMFETARMYKGSVGDVRIEDTYGITTFELG